MGVSLAIYRMRIGCFVMPRRSRSAVKTLRVSRVVVSTTVRAVLFLSMLVLLGGDVEVNPGPPKSQKQKTLSFADVSVTEPHHLSYQLRPPIVQFYHPLLDPLDPPEKYTVKMKMLNV